LGQFLPVSTISRIPVSFCKPFIDRLNNCGRAQTPARDRSIAIGKNNYKPSVGPPFALFAPLAPILQISGLSKRSFFVLVPKIHRHDGVENLGGRFPLRRGAFLANEKKLKKVLHMAVDLIDSPSRYAHKAGGTA
jgi:hypothetical protein